MVDTKTIGRRLHRGRARLQELGRLHDVSDPTEVSAREPSVLRALYLLFNEGYHGSDAENPLQPALCADALRLCELLLESPATSPAPAHASSALFCSSAARLAMRLDERGVFVPLSQRDRGAQSRAGTGRAAWARRGPRGITRRRGRRKAFGYPFFWTALADLERRAGRPAAARPHYERAVSLARSRAQRVAYERKLALLEPNTT